MRYLVVNILICISIVQCTWHPSLMTWEQLQRQAKEEREIRFKECQEEYDSQRIAFKQKNDAAKTKWENYSWFDRLKADSCESPNFYPDYKPSEQCEGLFKYEINPQQSDELVPFDVVWCSTQYSSSLEGEWSDEGFKIESKKYYVKEAEWNEKQCHWQCFKRTLSEDKIVPLPTPDEPIYTPPPIPPSTSTDCTFGEDLMGNTTLKCTTR